MENHTDSRGEGRQEGSYESKWQGETWSISWVKEPKSGWVVASCRLDSVAMSAIYRMVAFMLVLGVVALILATIISLRFADKIAKPIQSVAASVKGLTSGDLNARFDQTAAERSDEIGQIASNSIELARKLQDVIGRSKEMAGDLKHSGMELSGSSSQASEASGQVSKAVEDVSKGAVSQAESVQEAVNEMDTIGGGVEAIAQSSLELTDASKTMEHNCHTAMDTLKTLIGQSEKVSESVERIGNTIEQTNIGANEIG